MRWPSQEGHGAADRLSAGQAADGLVHNRLEYRGGKVLFVAPSLMRGWISDFANTRASAAIG